MKKVLRITFVAVMGVGFVVSLVAAIYRGFFYEEPEEPFSICDQVDVEGEHSPIPGMEGKKCLEDNLCQVNFVCRGSFCKGEKRVGACDDENDCTLDTCFLDYETGEPQCSHYTVRVVSGSAPLFHECHGLLGVCFGDKCIPKDFVMQGLSEVCVQW